MRLTANEARLIDRWQRGFPLVRRPYAEIGRDAGLSERDVIEMLRRLKAAGVLSRIGATVRPNTVGASTLAAIEVPPERLQDVAALVSSEPSVTHNYEREHAVNLWFVVTAANRGTVDLVLDRIRDVTGLLVHDLPLLRSYFVDLGFALCGPGAERVVRQRRTAATARICDADRMLVRAIEDGEGNVTVTLELMHNDPALSVPLLVAHDLEDVAADWRAWSEAYRLPMLLFEADGVARNLEESLGAVRKGEPRLRRKRATSAPRRPRFLARRKQGDLGLRLVVAGEEIIAPE